MTLGAVGPQSIDAELQLTTIALDATELNSSVRHAPKRSAVPATRFENGIVTASYCCRSGKSRYSIDQPEH